MGIFVTYRTKYRLFTQVVRLACSVASFDLLSVAVADRAKAALSTSRMCGYIASYMALSLSCLLLYRPYGRIRG